jgi:hypothetical protein
VTEDELVRVISALPHVTGQTASEATGAPEVAWGDTFFYYEPEGETDRMFPFATIVTKDYPGFDESSDLDRPDVYRLNMSVGRDRFQNLFGFPPAEFAEHRDEFDYAVLDRLLPHPAYGQQGWVSVLVPGAHTEDQVAVLIATAYERAKARHRPAR